MLGIGETTAKTHLQHIFRKTGTSKQTELMRLFMSSTPRLRQPKPAGAISLYRDPFNSWFLPAKRLPRGVAPKSVRLSLAASRDGSISSAFR